MHIFCDFDGTICLQDTTDAILSRFATPEWLEIEDQWVAGRISAATCMRLQVGLIHATDRELDDALDAMELAPGFPEFAAWCDEAGHPLTIVSDGVDRFIRRVLSRHGLDRTPVITNRLSGTSTARGLEQPWRRDGCAGGSGVCKCAIVETGARSGDGPLVFIGDGRSDFCASARADILFAKAALAEHARQRGIAFHPFDDFHDVTTRLRQLGQAQRAAVG